MAGVTQWVQGRCCDMLRYAAMMRGLHRFPMLSASWDLDYQNACCNKAFCSTVWPRSWCSATAVCSEERGEGNSNAASDSIWGKMQLDGINIDMAASDWQTASLYDIYIYMYYISNTGTVCWNSQRPERNYPTQVVILLPKQLRWASK